jgi:hypothetical protein
MEADYGKLLPVAIKAIQELTDEVEKLKGSKITKKGFFSRLFG